MPLAMHRASLLRASIEGDATLHASLVMFIDLSLAVP
jgi:hypothetical protein